MNPKPTRQPTTNGVLHIVALKEPYGGQNHTSARLKTKGLFSGTQQFDRAKLQ
jgi:hypothetical protein